ncbi:hypothetical protein [Streptomyces albireticuli]|uniref:hypothetical protein n=1 Tax=Streptomyces albireticuli TaxID=1940 RepID=UPI001331527B|nr:hypothetical protein [Streptomyces albireticuli]
MSRIALLRLPPDEPSVEEPPEVVESPVVPEVVPLVVPELVVPPLVVEPPKVPPVLSPLVPPDVLPPEEDELLLWLEPPPPQLPPWLPRAPVRATTAMANTAAART